MTWTLHITRIVALGLPLIGSLMAQMAIQLTDTAMLGRYDVEALAGQVLGSTLFSIALLFGAGFGWSVTPIIAEAEARGQSTEIRRVTRMAFWLSFGFGVAVLPVFLFAGPLFGALGQDPGTAAIAARYLAIQGFSIFPALGLMVIRAYLSGLGRTRAQFWAMVAAFLLNAVINYALIFGAFGFPELGVTGAAIGSVISTTVAFLALAVHAALATPEHELFRNVWKPDPQALARVFRLGWPIGTATLAEAGLFAGATVLMGWLGTVPLAAHGIAMQIISVIFMAHLGLSQAATIRAGNAVGRDDPAGLRKGAMAAMILSGCVALPTLAMLVFLPDPLIDLFLGRDEPAREAVLVLGRGLLAAAALFQLADAAQVMAMGFLRGLQDTRVPMAYAAISYWAIGMPLAWLLGFPAGLGGVGVWLGMAAGLTVAAVMLQGRFWRRTRLVAPLRTA
ncbi:multidrug resistance protein, MATE family [Palleronia marisminoris]|uniref:Multidrug-efflux transporter n=1 Tax=Palleronia marisminoris TaxID=315423 RepID=A0A1Y5ST64_9RHOB|nr:MATE family efflux transporter [Palleronia marisminoris]SFG98048.1 multidrug resistance protein, MATE family [Palleronia marisminoris]SLN47937.1 Multidrug resistance protein MdtK [Palleronia marisminoris]